jgi:hypothetical protein
LRGNQLTGPMSESIAITLIGSATTLIGALITYLATVRAAQTVAEATAKSNSQAGTVGEKEVRNQVSPPPPKEN